MRSLVFLLLIVVVAVPGLAVELKGYVHHQVTATSSSALKWVE